MTDDPFFIQKKMARYFEGVRTHPYDDATGNQLKPNNILLGKLTIGFGHNLTDNGLPYSVIETLLETDIKIARDEVAATLTYWHKMNEARKLVLTDMCFNMGLGTLLGFKRFHAAMAAEDYMEAAKEMFDSLWAEQVGNHRLDPLVDMIIHGEISQEFYEA